MAGLQQLHIAERQAAPELDADAIIAILGANAPDHFTADADRLAMAGTGKVEFEFLVLGAFIADAEPSAGLRDIENLVGNVRPQPQFSAIANDFSGDSSVSANG